MFMTIEPRSMRSTKNENNETSSAKADEVGKHKRDEASGATIDEVSNREGDKVPQVCASRADVEQSTEAPQQQEQQLSTAAVHASEHDVVQSTQQRTAEQVIDEPDETEAAPQLDPEPLDVSQRVVQAKAALEESISRPVRLELERVWFGEEAQTPILACPRSFAKLSAETTRLHDADLVTALIHSSQCMW